MRFIEVSTWDVNDKPQVLTMNMDQVAWLEPHPRGTLVYANSDCVLVRESVTALLAKAGHRAPLPWETA